MPHDRVARMLTLVVVALAAGCEGDEGGAARLSPSTIWVGDQDGRFRIEGPSPVAYLRGGAGEVRLVDDYAAAIGRLSSNVVPVASVATTSSVPPWSCTNCRDRYRPRPVPCWPLVVKNASNR